MQESDRLYCIIHGGYRHLNVVEGGNKIVLDLFVNYNPLKGTAKRIVVDLVDSRKKAYMELYYWSIVALEALLWLFFKDVDIVEAGVKLMYVLVAANPRKAILLEQLGQLPASIRRGLCQCAVKGHGD